jgi:methionyl-tRNA synthetase
MASKFYITTPLYYSSGSPSIGHAYTTLAADTLARFKRAQGFDVFFLTGNDEHGEKVEKAAAEAKKPVEKFVEHLAEEYLALWKKLDVSQDKFMRTTDPAHKKAVQKLLVELHKKGEIYKGKYEGWYCLQDEAYFPDSDIVDGKCPIGHKVERRSEESYFFKMSAYKTRLEKLFQKNPGFVQPENRRDEVLNFFKKELKDLSISRTTFTWGIPLPFDDKHRCYVWFDALLNYVTALGWNGDKKNMKFWPADVQLVGKDILRFHAVYWPCILFAAGLETPEKIYAHGWWTVEGRKMSKSFGNVVDPHKVVDKYGVDAFRYFLFREVPFGGDGDYSEKAIRDRYTGELAAEWGNLLNRVLVMIERYSAGEIPDGSTDAGLKEDALKAVKVYESKMEELKFHEAIESVMSLLRASNKFVNDQAPWELAKHNKQKELDDTLYNLAEALRVSCILFAPFMPAASQKAWEQLGLKGKVSEQEFSDAKSWRLVKKGTKIGKAKILFPKLD